MIFNVKEQPEHLCNIKVVQKMNRNRQQNKLFQDSKRKNYRKCQENGKYNI